jgi:hypothetical protein
MEKKKPAGAKVSPNGQAGAPPLPPGVKLLRTLEGHTERVMTVAFSVDGRLLASNSNDHTIRLWNCETWDTVSVIPEPINSVWWTPALAFHPTLPLLATAGSAPGAPDDERCQLIHLWELDYDRLLRKRISVMHRHAAPMPIGEIERAVHYTTGKIVLVGDHSVGKSALGHRLIHGEFKEQASTHGQRFWPFPWASAARTGPSARRFSGTSRASPTTGWSTPCSSTTPTWRWCCSTPRTCATRCMA